MLLSKNFKLVFLILIFALSFTLRFYKLGQVPNGLSTDEADMGYNAYSILKTGKDVYSRKLPLFFQSLDDYKAGFGIYSSVPAVKFFGLSEFSIRLFPAIIGSLTPLFIFFLIRLLYPKSQALAFSSLILTTFAPWNIAISRTDLPYIELIFFILLSLIFFLLGVVRNSKFFIISSFFFGFTLYVYYASIVYLPLILAAFVVLYRDSVFKNLKIAIISVSVLVLIALPALIHYQSPESKSRLNAISVFTPDVALPVSIAETEDDLKSGDRFSALFHNRRLVNFSDVLNNYSDYFNFDYLFVNSANTRYFYVNYVGLFYLIETPFFLYGLFWLFKRRGKEDILLLLLLLIGPIPASITLGSPLPHRGIILLLAIQIISAVGITTAYQNISVAGTLKRLMVFGTIAIYSLNVYFFLHQYFVHSPKEFSSESNNGAWFATVKDAIPKVNKLQGNYQKVIFTWSSSKLVPPVYFLFYNKVDPTVIQKKATGWINEPPSFRQIYSNIGNIEFRPINWLYDKNLKNTLFVGYKSDFSKDTQNVIDGTYLPSGEPHFLFVKSE